MMRDNHESRITNHESRITNHESRITNHAFTTNAGLLGEDVLRCTLEVTERLLQVDYDILEDSLTDADSRTLILSAILKEFTDDFYADQVEQISFRSLCRGESTVMAYPK